MLKAQGSTLLLVLALSLIAESAKGSEPVNKLPDQLPLGKASNLSTLEGKVMVGYQGWFNCEGDGSNLGWTHWSKNRGRDFGPGNVTVDLWPDISEYDEDELFDTGFRNADGSIARVFSSYSQKTVIRHFRWMEEYGIDGAFLQRFANELRSSKHKRHKDVVLSHVRVGAEQTGRSYAVMYDLSGLPKGGCKLVQQDWEELQKKQITSDAHYQRHAGKPLVAVWGIGFLDGKKPREYSLSECRELVEFLKVSGCSVMLGVPTGWRSLTRDSISDSALHDVIRLADVISPWTVGRYRDNRSIQRHATQVWKPDIDWCREEDVDYLPVVFPGFSWHNLTGEPLDSIPRRKGQFFCPGGGRQEFRCKDALYRNV